MHSRFMSQRPSSAARQRCAVLNTLESIAWLEKTRNAVALRLRKEVRSLDAVTAARIDLALCYLNRTRGAR